MTWPNHFTCSLKLTSEQGIPPFILASGALNATDCVGPDACRTSRPYQHRLGLIIIHVVHTNSQVRLFSLPLRFQFSGRGYSLVSSLFLLFLLLLLLFLLFCPSLSGVHHFHPFSVRVDCQLSCAETHLISNNNFFSFFRLARR